MAAAIDDAIGATAARHGGQRAGAQRPLHQHGIVRVLQHNIEQQHRGEMRSIGRKAADVDGVIADLKALDIVETAYRQPRPAPMPEPQPPRSGALLPDRRRSRS